MIIKLVRHGQSESNVGLVDVSTYGDSKVCLTTTGIMQARRAGEIIGKDFLNEALLFRSPYVRTRETSLGIMSGAGLDPLSLPWIEDPLLREIDLGYEDRSIQEESRMRHGWFYYRYSGGESPADVYTRCAIFINALMRKPKKNVVIVGHGLSLRVFIMRFMKLSVEEYTQMKNLDNCAVITICKLEDFPEDTPPELIMFKTNKWIAYGEMEYYHRNTYDPSPFLAKLEEFK